MIGTDTDFLNYIYDSGCVILAHPLLYSLINDSSLSYWASPSFEV